METYTAVRPAARTRSGRGSKGHRLCKQALWALAFYVLTIPGISASYRPGSNIHKSALRGHLVLSPLVLYSHCPRSPQLLCPGLQHHPIPNPSSHQVSFLRRKHDPVTLCSEASGLPIAPSCDNCGSHPGPEWVTWAPPPG